MDQKAIVYILQSEENGMYYVGSTTDLNRRLLQHRAGHTPTTKRMGPMKLMFFQEVSSLKIARAAERKIKSWKRKDFIEKILKEGTIRFLGR